MNLYTTFMWTMHQYAPPQKIIAVPVGVSLGCIEAIFETTYDHITDYLSGNDSAVHQAIV